MSDSHHTADSRPVLIGLIVILLGYAFALTQGWPQAATELIQQDHAHEEHGEHKGEHEGKETHEKDEHETDSHASQAEESESDSGKPWWMVLPFVLLLLAIAFFPLLPQTEQWWESNLHRFYVAAGLAAVTLLYYLFLHEYPVEQHWLVHGTRTPNPDGLNWMVAWTIVENGIFNEYVPFIVLLFSLFAISGGIRISGDLPAHPVTNTAFIGIGGLLASFIGTTGAAMLLIRPLLETNRERHHVRHTVVFFIFVVCNCGGLLLPIGDPPLFLGYLRGVPFLWTLNLVVSFVFVNGMLLLVYYLWDSLISYPQEKIEDVERDETQVRSLQFSGMINCVFLLGVVLSVALLDPSKPLPGTEWHAPLFLREAAQLFMVILSLVLTPKGTREANGFNYHAITEVAALFIGIFICMQPALQILGDANLNLDSPITYFWFTGGLSSVLDNAPTYVVFFELASQGGSPNGLGPIVAETGVPRDLLAAISLGAVFMGAMTYIGNGPNFMVKAIAEKSGIRMPSFIFYMIYSIGILGPILVLLNIILTIWGYWALPF